MQFERLASGFALTEAPRVDRTGALWFTDNERGIFRRNTDGGVDHILERPWVGGLVFAEDGGLVMTGRTLALRQASGAVRDLLTSWQGEDIPGFNDLTVDHEGGLLLSVMGFDIMTTNPAKEEVPPGRLFRLAPNGEVIQLADNILVPNGIGLSPDGRTIYHSDTRGHLVYAFSVSMDWEVTERRVLIELSPDQFPDGLAVDSEGLIWIAVAGSGGEILRVSPEGAIVERYKLPSTFVTSLSFGGADLRDLYVTTGNVTGDEDPSGSIFVARAPVAGLSLPVCRVQVS
ncbi:SMP-30/gluconolactonase/LRE family protein [Sinorhizobium meliloti]|uniref:SMP-30/gluconolactonase/LRE family protein n=1 Tax=Rhizobium meliloti TaxID=382 RepID=UPI003F1403C0